MLPTIARDGDAVVMIDQRKLPGQEVYVRCRSAAEVARAIKSMVIRGAPAIGVAAALGLALGMRRSTATGTQKFAAEFYKLCELMAATRPTAVNLFWAIDRMKQSFAAGAEAGESVDQIKDRLDREADRIHDEDVASCRAMGAHGAEVVPADARILTHCNAGALATAGYGTALGVIRGAVEAGKHVTVFADETRPFLQGARLTAWELVRDGIETTVITDNMAGALMRQGRVNFVVVGADRIAANGDTANKIGTYGVAVLAREHQIPFYVAAPLSTIDLKTPDGAHIPIEERSREGGHARRRVSARAGRSPDLESGIRRDAVGAHRGHHHRARDLPLALHRLLEAGVRLMVILGIETSCDETSAAVVEETNDPLRPWAMKSNVIASQAAIHREWGGVVPELASRQHLRDICGVVDRAIDDARVTWSDLGAIAVTQGPGLVGSLLVGVSFAKAAAAAACLPLVAVHHLAGHIESLVLQNGELPLPAVVLVVSGGHTSLYLVEEAGRYQLLSRTRDDAAGEAYDKVAKLLGLGYPGGPVVDRLATTGDDRAVRLPTTRLTHADRNAPGLKGDLDFSFSGLKTAVRRYVRQREADGNALTERDVADVCASFQRVVVTALIDRAFDAARRFQARSLGVSGGVSANSRLRAELKRRGEARELPTFVPSLQLSTDNAAMIAAAGLRKLRAGQMATFDLNADAALAL